GRRLVARGVAPPPALGPDDARCAAGGLRGDARDPWPRARAAAFPLGRRAAGRGGARGVRAGARRERPRERAYARPRSARPAAAPGRGRAGGRALRLWFGREQGALGRGAARARAGRFDRQARRFLNLPVAAYLMRGPKDGTPEEGDEEQHDATSSV